MPATYQAHPTSPLLGLDEIVGQPGAESASWR